MVQTKLLLSSQKICCKSPELIPGFYFTEKFETSLKNPPQAIIFSYF